MIWCSALNPEEISFSPDMQRVFEPLKQHSENFYKFHLII